MSHRVLVVDDSAVIRTAMRRAIAMCGVDVSHVFEAKDGIEALEVLEREWIDLVIADINMPRMDGVELVARMTDTEHVMGTPVIVVSSDTNAARAEQLRQLGVKVFVKKPFRPEGIRAAILEAIASIGADHE